MTVRVFIRSLFILNHIRSHIHRIALTHIDLFHIDLLRIALRVARALDTQLSWSTFRKNGVSRIGQTLAALALALGRL